MGHRIKSSFFLLLARSLFTQGARERCLSVNSQCHFLQRVSGSGYLNKNCNIPSRSFPNIQNMSCHMKARCKIYPRTELERGAVPDDKVSWDVEFPDYAPIEFTSPGVLKQPDWADAPDACEIKMYNAVDTDGDVDRRSFICEYQLIDGRPRNPMGRTGVTGRGCLGHWGPNHAADPIVTRWKRDEDGNIVKGDDGKQILQFVSVQRRDNGQWALPGGMVNPGEIRTVALKREFGEEALNSLEASDEEKEQINKTMNDNFKKGDLIYEGYVDDPRNTDNAWMETQAYSYHDEVGDGLGAFKLNAGDDAAAVQWMDINSTLSLYASHIDFIKKTVDKLNASW